MLPIPVGVPMSLLLTLESVTGTCFSAIVDGLLDGTGRGVGWKEEGGGRHGCLLLM